MCSHNISKFYLMYFWRTCFHICCGVSSKVCFPVVCWCTLSLSIAKGGKMAANRRKGRESVQPVNRAPKVEYVKRRRVCKQCSKKRGKISREVFSIAPIFFWTVKDIRSLTEYWSMCRVTGTNELFLYWNVDLVFTVSYQ